MDRNLVLHSAGRNTGFQILSHNRSFNPQPNIFRCMQAVLRISSCINEPEVAGNTRANEFRGEAEAQRERQQPRVLHTARDLPKHQHADVRRPEEQLRVSDAACTEFQSENSQNQLAVDSAEQRDLQNSAVAKQRQRHQVLQFLAQHQWGNDALQKQRWRSVSQK